jgi:hypothetical protein
VPVLSQINPLHTTLSYFTKIHFNIISHLRFGFHSNTSPSALETTNKLIFNNIIQAALPGYRSEVRVRFPALPDFLRSSGSGTGPLSLVSTTEELLGRKNSGSCLENREYGRRDSSRRPRGNLNPQKLALTSPTSGGRSVGIVRSRTKATEFVFLLLLTLF